MAIGTVKWFNAASGYGFIAPDDSGADLYVRTSNIADAGPATLKAGERVEFEPRVAGMGPEAVGVLRLSPDPRRRLPPTRATA
jgi:CspA family cold shock protein